ncbi:WAT1-related protein At5g40240-like [Hibiscus syriacus]|uniref:WAT1-related protein At5g40240-like n=1 Tax=Hibiscus syriacus TaxID=106335 RepID=UPI001923DED0|nr:WAT1-related protein At5g40240-like [Hibiscus syriacus]
MARRNGFKELVLPTIAMAAAQCSTVVVNILVKAASLKGMNYFVFVAYCYILGTLVFLLLASIFNRKTVLPPLKFPLFCRMFLLGVLGYGFSFPFYVCLMIFISREFVSSFRRQVLISVTWVQRLRTWFRNS